MKSEIILGISALYHDSSAAIVKDGHVIAAAAEERFSRIKHDRNFPSGAIDYCLEAAGLESINDLTAIVFYEKPTLKLTRIMVNFLRTWPESFSLFIHELPEFLGRRLNAGDIIRKKLPGYTGKLLFSTHHLSHAAQAFFGSPFDDAAFLIMDGVGETHTTSIGTADRMNRVLTCAETIHYPHSLGLLYSAFTAYLGFEVNEGEWKVMGLAAYGNPRYSGQIRKLIHVHEDNSFRLDLTAFTFQKSRTQMFNEDVFHHLFGFRPRNPEDKILDQHRDLAASIQEVVTELILGLARRARAITGKRNLVLGGGVALNGLANHAIRKAQIFDDIYVGPAPGDDGGAMGAALAVSSVFNSPLHSSFLGPEESDEDIKEFLRRRKIQFQHVPEKIPEVLAGELSRGKIIGVFHGRMEFGPRALGNRSILANPLIPGMKDILNEKIKFREDFRPFAPVVLLERVHEFFEVEKGASYPFMSEVVRARPEKIRQLGAAVHADGTARIQTVTETDHPLLYRILTSFASQTGIPVLINTSFNLRGEPIVRSTEDAVSTFERSGLDCLLLGDHLIMQKGSPAVPTDEFSVKDFYQELPFNYHSNAVVAASRLAIEDPLKQLPPLRKIAKKKNINVAEIGCGTGWFMNALAYHYGCRGTGFDQSKKAIAQARGVSRILDTNEKVKFQVQDLFQLRTLDEFDLINSFGVLHSTPDPHGAIRLIGNLMRPGTLFHLGLYHYQGRKPLLEHFRNLRDKGASEEDLYLRFRKLLPSEGDDVHHLSWFRDQILHPLESQHTAVEIHDLFESMGFTILGHSLNNFGKVPGPQKLRELDGKQEIIARSRLKKEKFFPGFFSILAEKKAHA